MAGNLPIEWQQPTRTADWPAPIMRWTSIDRAFLLILVTVSLTDMAYAHGVTGKDGLFLQNVHGVAVGPFLYLGAKHMVTGYDHLLFLVGVKLQEFAVSKDGLIANILSFNLGIELGQVMALSLILILLSFWRMQTSFLRYAFVTNTVLMAGGFLLVDISCPDISWSADNKPSRVDRPGETAHFPSKRSSAGESCRAARLLQAP